MDYQTLLIEIGTEELPPKLLPRLSHALLEEMTNGLQKAAIDHGDIQAIYSPRRLGFIIESVAAEQQSQSISRRGPSKQAGYDDQNQPSKALLGFAKSCGVSIEDLILEDTAKGAYFSYQGQSKAAKTPSLIQDVLEQAIAKLPISKPMRWGNHDWTFVRPVHWLLALWGDTVLDIELFGKKADNKSYGHRFHHPQAVTIKTPQEYFTTLEKTAFVIADPNERRARISKQLEQLALSKQLCSPKNPSLLEEVNNLVEWPNGLLCQFDQAFLKVPQEALFASITQHQKAFPLTDKDGVCQAYFVTFSNLNVEDTSHIIKGNEKVMRARLADAAFFFEVDQKQPLEHFNEALKTIQFQKSLGSMYQRAQRIAHGAAFLAPMLGCDKKRALRAGLLSKADLASDMVGEFPECQGIMGRYYALLSGEDKAVAEAIQEQYLPRFKEDDTAQSALGQCVALAEKLDTLTAMFGIGAKPSGSKDPFALRRGALGIIRTIIQSQQHLSLKQMLEHSAMQLQDTIDPKKTVLETHTFIIERLKAYGSEIGFSSMQIEAVLAQQNDDIYDFQLRLEALSQVAEQTGMQNLCALNKRIGNILKDKQTKALIDPELFEEAIEQTLFDASQKSAKEVQVHLKHKAYQKALEAILPLEAPVDRFFETIMVMCEDEKVRHNRIALLQELIGLLQSVASLDKLPSTQVEKTAS